MFKLLLSWVLSLAAIFSLPTWADIRVVDDQGQVVELAAPAERIISLAPNITESLFAIGAGGKIVGADEYSNYPEEAKAIQRVNNYQAANYEMILTLEPDLVLAWQSGNGDQIISRLRQLGLKVFVIEPRRLEDIPRVLKTFGELTGAMQQALAKSDQFDNALSGLRAQYQNKAQVSVFYQIWNEPLITLNGKHLVSDVIRLCGGHNVFADAAPLVPYVNIEAVLRADPQVIIASGSSADNPQWLQMWQQWPDIAAVRDGHVHAIPPDLMQRHSLRIIEGAGLLCEMMDQAR